VGLGPGGETLHLSPEGVAAEVAVALGVEKLILLQDAPGLVAGGELRKQLTVRDLEHQLADGVVGPDTKPVIHAILRALGGGVPPTPPSPSCPPRRGGAPWCPSNEAPRGGQQRGPPCRHRAPAPRTPGRHPRRPPGTARRPGLRGDPGHAFPRSGPPRCSPCS